MFSRNEKSILSDNYFLIVREEEKFIEIMSKNTGHCWIIYKKSGVADKPIDLYHKHTKATQYYHKHWQTYFCDFVGICFDLILMLRRLFFCPNKNQMTR